MTRPYVVFAESNVKTGCRAVLGAKTLIIGPNGSGKSAVANTVELALTGRVTDLVGRREVAKEAELMTLAPNKKATLQARVRLSNGQEAIWRVGGKSKKAAHIFPERLVDPATALPLRPVYDAVLGNADTARKFFMQYAVGAVGDADVLARIPAALHALYKRATLTTAGTTSAVDRLLAALEEAKKQARAASTAAKASEGLSDQTASGLAPLPTEAEEKALRDALRTAEAARTEQRSRVTRRESLATALAESDAIKAQMPAAELRYLSAKADADRLAQALAGMKLPTAADPNLHAFRTVLALHEAKGLPACECCGQGLGRATDNPSFFWTGRLRGLDAFLASQAAAARAYEEAKTAAATAAVKAEQAFAEGKALYARAQAVAAVIGDGATDAPVEADVAAVEAQVASLTEKLREVDALKAAWAVANRARDGVVEAKRNAQEWKDLVEACGDAVTALLDGGVRGFATKVQTFLPATDKYDLTLRDGDRAVFQFGLHKDGVLRTALSGAEWSRVMAAMAAVCAPRQDLVSVVIPEEKAFDTSTLTAVLAAFTALDSQVIFTSPVAPATTPPEWLVLRTERGDHTNGMDPMEGAQPAVQAADGVVPLERTP